MTAFAESRIRRRVIMLMAVAGVALSVLGFGAPPARAHAAFVLSQPQPGAQLSSAPGVVEIGFSEPIIVDLSSLTVTDPGGRRWSRTVAREQSMLATLDTNLPGVYVVAWKTVSPVDGHNLRGTFRFGVGATPGEEGDAAGELHTLRTS